MTEESSENETKDTDEDIVDDALDKLGRITEITGKGWSNKLLEPAAGLLGQRLKEKVQVLLEKKESNTQGHLDRVRERHPELAEFPDDPHEAQLVFDWSEKASNIDPDSDEASVWQSILEDILNKEKRVQSSVIDIAKQIDGDDLYILRIASGKFSQRKIEESERTEALERLGLMTKYWTWQSPTFVLFFLISMTLLAMLRAYFAFVTFPISLLEITWFIIGVIVAILLSLFFLTLWSNDRALKSRSVDLHSFRRSRYRSPRIGLTLSGERIVEMADRYAPPSD